MCFDKFPVNCCSLFHLFWTDVFPTLQGAQQHHLCLFWITTAVKVCRPFSRRRKPKTKAKQKPPGTIFPLSKPVVRIYITFLAETKVYQFFFPTGRKQSQKKLPSHQLPPTVQETGPPLFHSVPHSLVKSESSLFWNPELFVVQFHRMCHWQKETLSKSATSFGFCCSVDDKVASVLTWEKWMVEKAKKLRLEEDNKRRKKQKAKDEEERKRKEKVTTLRLKRILWKLWMQPFGNRDYIIRMKLVFYSGWKAEKSWPGGSAVDWKEDGSNKVSEKDGEAKEKGRRGNCLTVIFFPCFSASAFVSTPPPLYLPSVPPLLQNILVFVCLGNQFSWSRNKYGVKSCKASGLRLWVCPFDRKQFLRSDESQQSLCEQKYSRFFLSWQATELVARSWKFRNQPPFVQTQTLRSGRSNTKQILVLLLGNSWTAKDANKRKSESQVSRMDWGKEEIGSGELFSLVWLCFFRTSVLVLVPHFTAEWVLLASLVWSVISCWFMCDVLRVIPAGLKWTSFLWRKLIAGL